MKKLFFLLAFILYCLFLSAQGLGFKSIDKQINERPSLILFHQEEGLTISKSMQIDFDLRLNDINSFGYIVLLKNKENGENFSLTYSGTDAKTGTFKFNTDGVKNHFCITMPLDSIEKKWHKVSILFDLLNNKVVLSIGSFRQSSTQLFTEKLFSPLISMGRYEYVLDIPDFQIRNLNVDVDNSRYEFPLNESNGSSVHTSKGEIKGTIINPYWLINEAYNWNLFLEFKSSKPSGISFDENNQQFIYFNQDSLKLYSLSEKSMKNLKIDVPVEIQLGTHFVNRQNDQLFIYELNNLPKGDTTVAYFDLINHKWRATGIASLPVQLHHHNGFYDAYNHRYIIFGGFGNKRYSNIFYSYDINNDNWNRLTFTGDSIPPRFFSGMALKKDSSKCYIFGGMGNYSGDQAVGRIYYHDLFEISLENNKIKKLWDVSSDKRLVSTRDMILSKDENFIFALCYPEYLANTFLQLYRINIQSGEMIPVGDSIPMCSEEIATSANLYHNEEEEVFYCVIQEYDKKNRVQARIYSIKDLPVSLSEMRILNDNSSEINSLFLLMILLSVIIFLFLFFSLFTRQRNGNAQIKTVKSNKKPDLSHNERSMDEELKVHKINNLDNRHNSIFVFGHFTVIDRNGMNITHLFSTRLKLVFIYILLHSKDKGVLSVSLNEVFWPDKTDAKVKNLKGVTINQIRKNLSDIDGIDLVFEKGYFKLNFTDCYCDLIEFESLKESRSEFQDMNQILIRGKFLEGIESDIFDSYKLKMEEYLIVYLPLEIQKTYSVHKYDQTIRYCNILFGIDSINEKALFFYIHSMNKIHLSQDAILRYSIFSKEYRLMMNNDYSMSYNMILAIEPVVL